MLADKKSKWLNLLLKYQKYHIKILAKLCDYLKLCKTYDFMSIYSQAFEFFKKFNIAKNLISIFLNEILIYSLLYSFYIFIYLDDSFQV